MCISVIKACKALSKEPTRSLKTADDSGCSIVADAMDLEERAISAVWEKRSRFGIA
jgi:hypothetical protein